ncbi:uncharacterized protein LOC118435184 [Folsomia candida]|uniref:uncharacterized protein LOC118435184 n=1 Tax=Folsomia candida TaxID=158441 RepID=UPI0016052B95|nr:uncharacterized protein LOC118435184 [Folsomia candida]
MTNFGFIFALIFLLITLNSVEPCPDSPLGRQCDETSNRCPDSFTCTGGACSCRSDQVVSEESCKCVIKAGNIGCMIASQCTDGAYCRHPHKKNGERQWSHCECCSGPPEGSNGFCPPDKCHGYGA